MNVLSKSYFCLEIILSFSGKMLLGQLKVFHIKLSINNRDHRCFSCINNCQVSRKLFRYMCICIYHYVRMKIESLIFSLLEATCHLLITCANSLDPGQDQQNVCPILDPNCLTLKVSLKNVFEEKSQQVGCLSYFQ